MEKKFTYNEISREDSRLLGPDWSHCVHVMLHAALPSPVYLFDNKANEIKRTVMMQMRFDGRLGFPGGFVDPTDATLEDALFRELSEEMGTLPDGFKFNPDEYMFACRLEEKRYCLHFFCKEITYREYLIIETRSGNEIYEGFEVLGSIRVPLFKLSKMSGFPAFLRNNFIGFSRSQLLKAIEIKELLSKEKLDEYINLSRENDPLSSTIIDFP